MAISSAVSATINAMTANVMEVRKVSMRSVSTFRLGCGLADGIQQKLRLKRLA